MVEEQIDVEVLAVDDEALLASDEGEVRAQLEKKGLELAEDGLLEIALAVGVAKAQEVEQVGVAEHQIRRELVGGVKCVELLPDQLVWLLRQGRALVQHAADLGAEGADAPPLDTTHLSVEVAGEGFVDWEKGQEVAPAQKW